MEKTTVMLEHFIKAVVETTSTYKDLKSGNRPLIAHATEEAEFASAKSAIEIDLEHLLSLEKPSGANDVYSVHFSDINGLSKLENSILAHEISVYLCKYTLRYVTLLYIF